jgi:hypothetical protein
MKRQVILLEDLIDVFGQELGARALSPHRKDTYNDGTHEAIENNSLT